MSLPIQLSAQGLVLLACAVTPAVVCQWFAAPPQVRHVHVQSFRYGKRPSVIRVNRGDRLHLTFESLDTGHSFFLEEFNIDAKHSPGTRRVELFRTDDPTAPPQITDTVVFEARHPGLKNYLVSKSIFRDHVWTGPMHAFEHGHLIIAPNTLLYAAMGALLGLPIAALVGLLGPLRDNRADPPPADGTEGWDVLASAGWLKRLVKRRDFQFTVQAPAMVLFYLVILTTLLGTKMPGRNMGIMLLWVVWLFLLTAVLTPLGGRIWCLACPLPMFGEWLQRGAITQVRSGNTNGTNNRFFGANLPWPKWLENAWPRTLLFLALGTFSIALVAVPKVSGWLLVGLLVVATGIALLWPLRAFCRYLCPINGFVGLYAMCGKLAVRSQRPEVCARCELRTCRSGSDRGWACPYGLCVADIRENNDCGLCTECVKSCVYDNVTLRCRPFGSDLAIRTAGEAWLAMAMLVLAVAYCLVHLGPWPEVRDWVNILDKGNWHMFAVYAAVLWLAALAVFPALMALAARLGNQVSQAQQPSGSLFVASTGALVPVGLSVWIAFVVPMLLVNVTFVIQSISDPFGWGWDLLGTANTPWHQLWPSAIPWVQAIAVLTGLAYGLRAAWRIWLRAVGRPRAALRGMIPLAVLLFGLSGWLLWFFVN